MQRAKTFRSEWLEAYERETEILHLCDRILSKRSHLWNGETSNKSSRTSNSNTYNSEWTKLCQNHQELREKLGQLDRKKSISVNRELTSGSNRQNTTKWTAKERTRK